MIKGLTSKAGSKLNGTICVSDAFNADTRRHVIKIRGNEYQIHEKNLKELYKNDVQSRFDRAEIADIISSMPEQTYQEFISMYLQEQKRIPESALATRNMYGFFLDGLGETSRGELILE